MPTYVSTINSVEVAELITEGPDRVTQVVVHDADENGGTVAYTITPGLAEVLAQFLSYAQNYVRGDVLDKRGDYLAALDDYDALLTRAATVINAATGK